MGQYANSSDEHKYHYYTWLLGESIVIARYEYSITNRLLLAASSHFVNYDFVNSHFVKKTPAKMLPSIAS